MLQVKVKDKVIDINDCDRTLCEVWTRIVGYYRPISEFNIGRKQEHAERIYYTESKTMRSIVGA
jgi:anaerobic ribonucleoside-triphosphate reductase